MYNTFIFKKNPLFPARLLRPLQTAKFSSGKQAQIAIKQGSGISTRYSPKLNSDSFFVDRSRLTKSESIYQSLSTGFSVISVLFLVSFPLGLFFFLTSNKKRTTQPSSGRNSADSTLLPRVPVLTSSKALFALLNSRVPVLILYFKQTDNGSNSLPVRVTRVLLEELSTLFSRDLKIVSVDLNLFEGHLSQSLDREATSMGGTLFHLLVPNGTEPLMTTLAPLTTVESFIAQIQSILAPYTAKGSSIMGKLPARSNVPDSKGSVDPSRVDTLDNSLSLLRNCLFELELKRRSSESLSTLNSLDSMLQQCQSLNL